MTNPTEVLKKITKEDIDELIQQMDKLLLESDIERTREEMVSVGMSKGLAHPETVELSQKLDCLLNKLSK
jgi:hypothetical protein